MHFYFGTTILYIFLCWYFYYTSKQTAVKEKKNNRIILICIIPIVLAVFRKVTPYLGGTDAYSYIQYFVNINNDKFSTMVKSNVFGLREPVYFFINKSIRILTDDYHLFFIVIYTLIVMSQYYFVREIFKKSVVFSPLIYLVIYYLQSYNLVRFSLAMAFVVIGFTLLSKNKRLLAIVFCVLGALCHFSTSIALLAVLAYLFYSSEYFNKAKWYIVGVIFINVVFFILKSKITLIFSSTEYRGYIENRETIFNLFLHITTIICALLSIINFKKLKDKSNFNRLMFFLVMFDFALIPASIFLKLFRLHLMFVLPRLYMWGQIIECNEKRMVDPKQLRIVCGLLIVFWTIFRVLRDASGAGWFPYIFDLL